MLLLTSFFTPYYSPPYFLLPLSFLLTTPLLTPYYPLLPTYFSSPYSLLLPSLLPTSPLPTPYYSPPYYLKAKLLQSIFLAFAVRFLSFCKTVDNEAYFEDFSFASETL